MSSSALAALKEFYADRDTRLKQFEDLKAVAEEESSNTSANPLSIEAFAEDWNESQFWVRFQPSRSQRQEANEGPQYSDETATILAQELLRGAGGETKIAVVSAPSVFVQLKNILVCQGRELVRREAANASQAASGKDAHQKPKIWLLEFDKRFEVFSEFVFYDFKQPLKLPRVFNLPKSQNRAADKTKRI